MELAILISVNLLISFLVYVAFSVRFRMALEKERKNRIPRAFYDNLQMTIQYINTATNSVDEKTEAFYRLVLKSEEVARRLEKANEEFEKNLKKSKRKRKAGPISEPEIPDHVSGNRARTTEAPDYAASAENPARGAATSRDSYRGPSRNSEAYDYGQHTDPFSSGLYSEPNRDGGQIQDAANLESDAEGQHMDRLLSAMDNDVVHFTGQEESFRATSNVRASAATTGSAAAPFRSRSGSAATGASGLLARIGGLVGRVLGINPSSFQMNSASEDRASQENRNPEAVQNRFDREVNRMARAPAFRENNESMRERRSDTFLASEEEGALAGGRKDYYVSGMDPQSDVRKDLYSKRLDSQGQPESANSGQSQSERSQTVQEPAPGESPPEHTLPDQREQNNVAGQDSQSLGESRSSATAGISGEERRIARVQEFLESTGINLLDTTPQTRAVLIRELGSLGFEPPDIVRATRFPPSEVALVLDLPEANAGERRRTRRIQK